MIPERILRPFGVIGIPTVLEAERATVEYAEAFEGIMRRAIKNHKMYGDISDMGPQLKRLATTMGGDNISCLAVRAGYHSGESVVRGYIMHVDLMGETHAFTLLV
jgi:hypothetical protein